MTTAVTTLTSAVKKMNVNGSNGNQANRRRNRRARRGMPGNIMPGGVRIKDTEIFSLTKASDVLRLPFCPGKTTLPRLDNEAAKFGRWSLVRVIITYQPTASLADKGAITYGILPGPPSDKIKSEGDIMKLRPFQKHALWKSSSLTVTNTIMIQKHMYTNANSEDAVGFTIYISTADNALGILKLNYEVVLNYPKP